MEIITDQHIYNRIAHALNKGEITRRKLDPEKDVLYSYEEVRDACERLHEKGLNVTTYADAQFVAKIIYLEHLI